MVRHSSALVAMLVPDELRTVTTPAVVIYAGNVSFVTHVMQSGLSRIAVTLHQ